MSEIQIVGALHTTNAAPIRAEGKSRTARDESTEIRSLARDRGGEVRWFFDVSVSSIVRDPSRRERALSITL